jgi:hypothetical protein
MNAEERKLRITVLRKWLEVRVKEERELVGKFSIDQQQAIDSLLTADNWKHDTQAVWMRKAGRTDWNSERGNGTLAKLPNLVTVQGAVLGIHYVRGMMAGAEEELEELEIAETRAQKKATAATKKGGKS